MLAVNMDFYYVCHIHVWERLTIPAPSHQSEMRLNLGVTSDLDLTDHHCHGLLPYDIPADEFRILATESDWLSPAGTETLDSPFGLAVRSLCAPLLGLERHSSIDEYLARRTSLGYENVHRTLMAETGTTEFLVESGFRASPVMTPGQMREATGQTVHEVGRIETIAEAVAADSTPGNFCEDFRAALELAAQTVIGFKTIIAYRFGFDIEATPPAESAVTHALHEWFGTSEAKGSYRLDHPVILQHILWETVSLKMPIQMHVGYGDSDVELFRADPTRLTRFLSATRTSGATFALLHCYPFVRESAILAQLFPHVYFDVGLVSHYLGPSVSTALREAVEIAPFNKLLYSSDAYGLAEHYLVSSKQWRRGINTIFDEWIADDWLTVQDAKRFSELIASGNARRLYALDITH